MIQVLLVEDDPMVAELNRLYVDRVGGFSTVAAVGDGAAALAVLRSRPIDLLLLDVFMPGPNGVELLTEIRAAGLDVDVIFVTAARDTRTIDRALKLGAMDYLIKPFEFERMKQALEHYRERHRLLHEEQPASQADVDRALAKPSAAARGAEALPKGLDRATLERVWAVVQRQDDGFTSEAIASGVGLTRVSVRKYLEFLCAIQVLRMEPSYGPVGRPVHRYEVRRAFLGEIRRFL